MRVLRIAGVALAGALALVASVVPGASTTTATAAPPAAPAAVAPAPLAIAPAARPMAGPQAEYVATMRALLVGKPGQAQSDATLIDGGKSICTQIDDGATRETFEAQIAEFDLDRTVYRVIVRSSIKTFCPQHIDQAIR